MENVDEVMGHDMHICIHENWRAVVSRMQKQRLLLFIMEL